MHAASISCSTSVMRLLTLKTRADFQRVRGGLRVEQASFVLEGKQRSPSEPWPEPASGPSPAAALQPVRPPPPHPRFGFTITKKLGNAVVRNRMRRRLKAAFAASARPHADPTFDYVVVARPPAAEQPFAALLADVTAALDRIGALDRSGSGGRARPPRTGRGGPPPPDRGRRTP
jgi:ribonuclease P protein component